MSIAVITGSGGLIGSEAAIYFGDLGLYDMRPAQIFGLFPRKGTIAIGSDADLVIWDTQRERTIRQSELHHAVDYTLDEGRAVRGAPRTVMLRGDVLVENETFIGRPGTGQFLWRQKYRGRNIAPAA